MCPESLVEFVEGREANIGDNAVIRNFTRGAHHFALYARTSDLDCPICLPDESTVRFTNLPLGIQQRAEVGPEAVAVLENGAFYTSTFRFDNHATATLDELVGCTFMVIPAIEEIDREAREVMDEVGRNLGAEATETAMVAVSTRSNVARGVGAVLVALLVALIVW